MKPQIKGLNIVGYTDGMFGLGEAIRLNIKAAKEVGIPVNLINYEKVKQNTNYQYSFKYSVNLVQISLMDLESFFANIDPNFFKKRYSILFLVWESEYIAPELAENLNLFNEIWTPSEYCKKIFQKTFSNPIIIVPHPVEIHLDPLPNDYTINFFDKNKFSFLFLFSYHSSVERKNPLFLIEAFKTAFGDNENVELIIKTVGGEQFKQKKRCLNQSISYHKNINIYDINLDKNSINNLINNCDCYISLHHSEGFGLTLAEAMFLGKPTIATNYSGNTEFMKENNSFLVDYELGLIENPDNNFCAKTVWANPIMHDTVQNLREIYKNSTLRLEKANNARIFIKEKLSFYSIGSIMNNRMTMLYDNFDDLVLNQNTYFIDKLQLAKIETAQLKREIRRMKKNMVIRFIIILKDTTRKFKKKYNQL